MGESSQGFYITVSQGQNIKKITTLGIFSFYRISGKYCFFFFFGCSGSYRSLATVPLAEGGSAYLVRSNQLFHVGQLGHLPSTTVFLQPETQLHTASYYVRPGLIGSVDFRLFI